MIEGLKWVKDNVKTAALFAVLGLLFLGIGLAGISKHSEASTILVVVKKGTRLYGIADQLKKQDMIYSSNLFVLSSLAYGGRLMAGEYELKRNMSTWAIVRKMGRGERNVYALQIVEGHNIYDVSDTILKKNIMDKQEFLTLAKDREYLSSLGINSDSLEGYLAPDTYHYSREVDAKTFIAGIAKRTINYFEREETKKQMNMFNFDVNKTLTLASMIEKEARVASEKPIISAVFHNRIMKGMPFDSDPTVIYGRRSFGNPIRKSDLKTYTPYNTYSFRGFPKGPICNPDWNSIDAALNPAPVEYLYFVSKNDGTHVFSKDMNEHNKYVNMYQRPKRVKK